MQMRENNLEYDWKKYLYISELSIVASFWQKVQEI